MKKKIKELKKGDKVKVLKRGMNDSLQSIRHGLYLSHTRGVYSIVDWNNKVFEIEGTVELVESVYPHLMKKSYLLTLEGVKIGFVYDIGIEKVTK